MKIYGVTSLGLKKQGLSPFFNEATLINPIQTIFSRRMHAVLAWGNKPSSNLALALARRRSIPILRLEDGFIFGVTPRTGKRLSLVIDDLGIYYDSTHPSRLEGLIINQLTDQHSRRAQNLRTLWIKHSISKYNHAPIWVRPTDEWFKKPFVLLVDQTKGDASITGAMATSHSFRIMLEAALAQTDIPNILIKAHPEVVSGHKIGHFDYSTTTDINQNPRVRVMAQDFNLGSVINQAAAVYTVSSQAGFEGLLWGKPVHTFGMPFYAGWGLTNDHLSKPLRRSELISLEQLIVAALISYPRYVDPTTNLLCEVEDVIHHLASYVIN